MKRELTKRMKIFKNGGQIDFKKLDEKIDDHEFIFNDVPDEFDYITANELNHTTEDISDVGEEGNFNINFKHNIQWSSSVFTHMTKNRAQTALMSIANAADDKSAQINSWLIIDNLSRLAMKTGPADRNLEHEMDGFYTNNLKSPLECTAFKEDVIYDLYKNAGLKDTSIEYGNWRNNEIANERTGHYQDIIISRKINA